MRAQAHHLVEEVSQTRVGRRRGEVEGQRAFAALEPVVLVGRVVRGIAHFGPQPDVVDVEIAGRTLVVVVVVDVDLGKRRRCWNFDDLLDLLPRERPGQGVVGHESRPSRCESFRPEVEAQAEPSNPARTWGDKHPHRPQRCVQELARAYLHHTAIVE